MVFYTVIFIGVALAHWLMYEAIMAFRYEEPIRIGDRTCRFPRGFHAQWEIKPATLKLSLDDFLPVVEQGSPGAVTVKIFNFDNPELMRSRAMASRLAVAAQTETDTRMVGTTNEGFAIYVRELQRQPLRVERSYIKREASGYAILIDDPDVTSEVIRVSRQVSPMLEVEYELPRGLLAHFAQTDARVVKIMQRYCSERRQ